MNTPEFPAFYIIYGNYAYKINKWEHITCFESSVDNNVMSFTMDEAYSAAGVMFFSSTSSSQFTVEKYLKDKGHIRGDFDKGKNLEDFYDKNVKYC
jgi:hypothetical protein